MNEEELVQVNGDDIANALLTINECLVAVSKRLEEVEKYVSELPTPDKTYYKPRGYTDYLNIKENFDELYRRVTELENGV